MPYILYENDNGTPRLIANITETSNRAASSVQSAEVSGGNLVFTRADGNFQEVPCSGLTAGFASELKTPRIIDGVSFSGSSSITHYGICRTSAGAVEKAVSCEGFSLSTGARIIVSFAVTSTAENATLNVNGTGAKPINYRGAPAGRGYLVAGRTYEFVYSGDAYEFIGDVNTGSDNKVEQIVTTVDSEYPILAAVTAGNHETRTEGSRFSPSITLNPATGTISGREFTGNAGTATRLSTARKISITGGITGTAAAFDGSGDVAINVTSVNPSKLSGLTGISITGNAGTATRLSTARTLDGVSFSGESNISHYGECSTSASAQSKEVSCTGFSLAKGSRITVRFTVTNTASSPSLNVNGTGAKPIRYRGSAISTGTLAKDRTYTFIYDGENYSLVGDIDTTNTRVSQYATATNAEYPIMAAYTAGINSNKTEYLRFSSGVTMNPATGTITANRFVGTMEGTSGLANSLSVARTFITKLDSEEAASFNGTADANIGVSGILTVDHGGTGAGSADGARINLGVPPTYHASSVDTYGMGTGSAYGHVKLSDSVSSTYGADHGIAATPKAVGTAGTTVAQKVSTTNNKYPLLAAATANKTATSTEASIFAAAVTLNPSTGAITATSVYNAVWNDYAEWFARAENEDGSFVETEPGDIIALDIAASSRTGTDVYRRATEGDTCIAGIHSDTYGHIVGGTLAPDGIDDTSWNLRTNIPVGLAGRVWCRMENAEKLTTGDIGKRVVPSKISGLGRLMKDGDSHQTSVGFITRLPDADHEGRALVKICAA